LWPYSSVSGFTLSQKGEFLERQCFDGDGGGKSSSTLESLSINVPGIRSSSVNPRRCNSANRLSAARFFFLNLPFPTFSTYSPDPGPCHVSQFVSFETPAKKISTSSLVLA